MAELIVHGIVNGQEISKCSELGRKFCEGFYNLDKGIKKDIRRLAGNNMAYSYVMYEEPGRPFLGHGGRSGSYFGITIIFKDQQVANPEALFKVLESVYNWYVKDKVIKEYPSGARRWIYPTLSDPDDKVANYIGSCVQQVLKANPNLVKYQPLPPLQQQQGRGSN